MSCPACNFLKNDGVVCGSPALRGKKLCFYHQRDEKRRKCIAGVIRRADPLSLRPPVPKSLPQFQSALFEVMNALADGRIHCKRAGVLLFGLQQARTHIRNRSAA